MLFLDGFFFTQSQRQFLDTWVKKVFPKSLYGEDYETQLWNGCSYLLHMHLGRTIKAYKRLLTTHWNNYYYLGLTHNFYVYWVGGNSIDYFSQFSLMVYDFLLIFNVEIFTKCKINYDVHSILKGTWNMYFQETIWVFNMMTANGIQLLFFFFFCRILNCNEITLPKVFRDTNL